MHFRKVVLTLQLIGLFLIGQTQDFNCYEIIGSDAGYINLYRDFLEDKACEVETFMGDNGVNGFKVTGRDFYPPLVYANPYKKAVFEEYYNKTVTELEADVANYSSFILITKDHLEFGHIFYRLALKLPNQSPFNDITPLEEAAIKAMVLEAINQNAGKDAGAPHYNSRAETAGLDKLLFIFNAIINGTFSIDINQSLEKAGFQKVAFGNNPFSLDTDSCEEANISENVFDYACLKIAGTDAYIRDNAIAAHGQIYFPSPAVIMTANNMNNYGTRLKAANNEYETLDHAFIFWLHFEISDGMIEVFYKTRTNISEADAQALMDMQYENQMNDYWSVGEDNSPPAFRGEENKSNARNSTEGSYDCTQLEDCLPTSIDQIKKWRAYCCLLPPQTFKICPGCSDVSIEDNSVLAMEAGMASGVVDGLWETLLFIYQAGSGLKTALDHVPFTVGWFVQAYERIRDEGSFYKGLQKKFGEDKAFWGDIAKFVVNLAKNIGKVWSGIKRAIKSFLKDLSIQSGLAKTGYAIGKIIFEVIMTYLTGGTSSFTKISKFSDNAFAFFKELATNPRVVRDKTYAYWSKSSAKAAKLKCRILAGGCFLAGTPVLVVGMQQVPIETISLGTSVYAHATINQRNNLTASINNSFDNDPFTSNNQKEIDKIGLEEEQWYKIKLELKQLNGSISKIQLLRPKNWLKKNDISQIADKIWLSMPEQGLNGYATVISLAHFRFTKIPEEENSADDYELRPVTGIFEHTSNDVWKIVFDSGDTLGVTGGHPIYSLDYGDWRLAGELIIGEQVLTRNGFVEVLSKDKIDGIYPVFNMEVRGLHNFLVGKNEVLVHNSCKEEIRRALGRIKEPAEWRRKYLDNDPDYHYYIDDIIDSDGFPVTVYYDKNGFPDFKDYGLDRSYWYKSGSLNENGDRLPDFNEANDWILNRYPDEIRIPNNN